MNIRKILIALGLALGAFAVFAVSIHFISTQVAEKVAQQKQSPLGGAIVSRLCQTASATGTVAYIPAGKATTTLPCDLASALGTDPLKGVLPVSANLAVEFVASSTASILDMNLEYSNDNVDWYQATLSDRSTTTPTISTGAVQNWRFQFASSTAGLPAVPAIQSTTTRMITIDTPTRYVRAVFTTPAGSTQSAVWAEITAKKEF